MIVALTDKNGKPKTKKQLNSVIDNMLNKRQGRLRFLESKIVVLQSEYMDIAMEIQKLESQKKEIEG